MSLAAIRSLQPARPLVRTTAGLNPYGPSHRTAERGASAGCYALDISDDEYHGSAPGVSSTGLKALLRSPAHFLAYKRNANRDTASRRFGRAVHAKVLEPAVFNQKFVVWDLGDRRGSDFELFQLKNHGKTILTADEFERVQGCEDSLLNNPDFPLEVFLRGVPGELEAARAEFSIFWTDDETGVKCKVRLDAVRIDGTVMPLDLKSCDDAREEGFVQQVSRLHYDLQAAFYLEGLKRFTGQDAPFLFGAVESADPHCSMFHIMGSNSEWIANGRRKMRHALNALAECERCGQYPGYPHRGVNELSMPHWLQWQPPSK